MTASAADLRAAGSGGMSGRDLIAPTVPAFERAAQVEVVARHFGEQRDLRILQRCLAGIGIRTRGFHRAAYATEQIELPRRIETRLVLVDGGALVGEAGLLLAAPRIRRTGLDVGDLLRLRRTQRRAGLAPSGLTRPTTAVVGSGAGAAVDGPVDEAHYAPQVINPATGAVTTLGEAPSAAGPSVSRITLARDGVLVASKSETVAYNTGGAVVGTVRAGWELDRLPTSDREVPSVADLSSFLTQGSAPWTTGTVERPYPNDDYSYTMVAVSTSGESYRIKPGESFPEMPEYNTWHAAQVRASAEGNALYIQGVPSAQRRAFFFNMSRDMTYVLPRLDDATNVVWVFDDLLVGTSNGAVVAFTPARQ